MNSKIGNGCVAVVLVLALSPLAAMAQQIGFQTGIAQPSFPMVTPQPPAIAVRGTILWVPAQIPIVPTPVVPTPIVPNPNPVFGPAPVFIPAPLLNPQIVVVPSVQAGLPLSPVVGRRIPPIGTPRAEVLRLLGQPTTMVISGIGETLYFTNGITVIIENGLLAGPR
jgi:hypothetical protein